MATQLLPQRVFSINRRKNHQIMCRGYFALYLSNAEAPIKRQLAALHFCPSSAKKTNGASPTAVEKAKQVSLITKALLFLANQSLKCRSREDYILALPVPPQPISKGHEGGKANSYPNQKLNIGKLSNSSLEFDFQQHTTAR